MTNRVISEQSKEQRYSSIDASGLDSQPAQPVHPRTACIPASSCTPNCGVAPWNSGVETNHAFALDELHFLWLELISKCNLRCVHCYADSGPHLPLLGRMTYLDWRRVLAEAADLGCRQVQFIGGEPTIYPDLLQLIRDARALRYELVEVFTNGTTFNQRLKQAFLSYKVHLAFSVYSTIARVHDSITLSQGSFQKTRANIQWALENGLTVRAAIIKMNENADDIDKTKTFLEELGIKDIQIDLVRDVGRGHAGKEAKLRPAELCGRCWEGKLCVTSTGEMFPCVFARRWPVGAMGDNIRTAVHGAALQNFRSDLREKVQAKTQVFGTANS